MSLLQIENLNVVFRHRFSDKPVLRDICLQLERGEVCALVGESGAGKSMVAKSILGLLPQTARVRSGRIVFDGINLLSRRLVSKQNRRKLVGQRIALIPQDPMVSLNPVKKIGLQMSEFIRLHLNKNKAGARDLSLTLLQDVMINDAERVYDAYAHQLSGGMRQRVLIAMAFACKPDLIIADEPTTALDVTVQMQVLKLLRKLQQQNKTTILFVTHDLGVVSKIADRVVVMFDGRVVEDSTAQRIFNDAAHEYTRALLMATPRHDLPLRIVTPVPKSLIDRLRQETLAVDNAN